MPAPDQVARAIETAMAPEHERFRTQWRLLSRIAPAGDQTERKWARLCAQIARSAQRRELRQAQLPTARYDESLPIHGRRHAIAAAIAAHPVVIVSGETGSGKSTQLPKIRLEMGPGVDGMIGHTQPRRIAARSIAARLAEELGTLLGDRVGYKIRFSDRTGPGTYVKALRGNKCG